MPIRDVFFLPGSFFDTEPLATETFCQLYVFASNSLIPHIWVPNKSHLIKGRSRQTNSQTILSLPKSRLFVDYRMCASLGARSDELFWLGRNRVISHEHETIKGPLQWSPIYNVSVVIGPAVFKKSFSTAQKSKNQTKRTFGRVLIVRNMT